MIIIVEVLDLTYGLFSFYLNGRVCFVCPKGTTTYVLCCRVPCWVSFGKWRFTEICQHIALLHTNDEGLLKTIYDQHDWLHLQYVIFASRLLFISLCVDRQVQNLRLAGLSCRGLYNRILSIHIFVSYRVTFPHLMHLHWRPWGNEINCHDIISHLLGMAFPRRACPLCTEHTLASRWRSSVVENPDSTVIARTGPSGQVCHL